MPRAQRDAKRDAVRITSAARPRSADIWAREKRYMVTMGIRTACFIAAVAIYLSELPAWLAWVFLGGSLVLPYIAVVMANAGVTPDPGGPDPFDPGSGLRELPAPRVPDERDSSEPDG